MITLLGLKKYIIYNQFIIFQWIFEFWIFFFVVAYLLRSERNIE